MYMYKHAYTGSTHTCNCTSQVYTVHVHVGVNKELTKIRFSLVAMQCWYCEGSVKCSELSAAVRSKCETQLTVRETPASGNSGVRCGAVHCGTVWCAEVR